MSATVLTVLQAPGFNAGLLDIGAVAPDNVNGNLFSNDGKTALIVQNASVAPITLTFTLPSSPTTGNGQFASTQVKTIGAGKIAVLGMFEPGTFNNVSGQVAFLASAAASVTVTAVQFLQTQRV